MTATPCARSAATLCLRPWRQRACRHGGGPCCGMPAAPCDSSGPRKVAARVYALWSCCAWAQRAAAACSIRPRSVHLVCDEWLHVVRMERPGPAPPSIVWPETVRCLLAAVSWLALAIGSSLDEDCISLDHDDELRRAPQFVGRTSLRDFDDTL